MEFVYTHSVNDPVKHWANNFLLDYKDELARSGYVKRLKSLAQPFPDHLLKSIFGANTDLVMESKRYARPQDAWNSTNSDEEFKRVAGIQGGGMMMVTILYLSNTTSHPYRWSLEDVAFTKDKGKYFVFVCKGLYHGALQNSRQATMLLAL